MRSYEKSFWCLAGTEAREGFVTTIGAAAGTTSSLIC
jgi:hypothetical protein